MHKSSKKKKKLKTLPFNSKTHATLNKKIFVNLYAEDLYFLTTGCGWKVIKIYDNYTFKQDTFKKDFVVMNQNAGKIAKTKVEKYFYKLLNNSNFGNDCRNNIGNCKMELIYDGLVEISYIKKFTNIMQDNRFREFFTVDLPKQQVKAEFNTKSQNVDQDEPFYFSIYESLSRKLEEDLEAIEQFSKKRKRKIQLNKPINSIENKIKNCSDIRKNKMLIEFNDHQSCSVKSIVVKSETNIKCTSRFMSGKQLMFAKVSLKSFIRWWSFCIFQKKIQLSLPFMRNTISNRFIVIKFYLTQTALRFNLLLFLAQPGRIQNAM